MHGVTKFLDNGDYAMLLVHVLEGNLRDYLPKNHLNLTLILYIYYILKDLRLCGPVDEK